MYELVAPNGASFGAGRFSTPSLAELRAGMLADERVKFVF